MPNPANGQDYNRYSYVRNNPLAYSDPSGNWLGSFGRIIAVGVESTGSFGAGLARSLAETGCRVIEINQPHPHTRARRGKNDAIDAEAAARKVLSGEATGAAKDTTGIVERIRQLSVARDGAVKARAAGALSTRRSARHRPRSAARTTRESQDTRW